MNEPRTVWAIQLPMNGDSNSFWTVCRAETPAGAAAVIEHILRSGDKKIQLIRVMAEVAID